MRQRYGGWPLARRRFLQTLLGLMSGIGLPVWARPKCADRQFRAREADFYRAKERGEP